MSRVLTVGRAAAPDRLRLLTIHGKEVCVREWGDAAATPLLAFHGLGRTGSDFGPLATALRASHRVIAPDCPGRGLSQWLDTAREYDMDRMEAFAKALVEAVLPPGVRCAWLGTSAGGMLGINTAGGPLADRISHLVLNDVGPVVPPLAVERIRQYSASVYAPYGAMTEEEWMDMTVSSSRKTESGNYTLHYDPKIMESFLQHGSTYNCWDRYGSITCPILILRGEHSDVLPSRLAGHMMRVNRRAHLAVMPNCGHAPALNTPYQINTVAQFIAEGGTA